MSIYIGVLAGTIIFSGLAQQYRNRNRQMRNFLLFVTIALLTIVAGLRYKVGVDYTQYMVSFPKYVENVFEAIKAFNEPGIYVIAWLGSKIINEPVSMFLITAIVVCVTFGITISKQSNNYMFSFAIFLFAGCWTGSFNAMRQYLACIIVFAAHRYIYTREWKKYFLAIILAMAFHRSAIIMLVFYFLIKNKVTIKNTLVLMLAGLAISRWNDSILLFIQNNTEKYSNTDIMSTAYVLQDVSALRILVNVVPILVALVFYGITRINLNPEKAFYYNLFLLNGILAIGTGGSAYLARMLIYSNIFLPLAYPKVFDSQSKQGKILRGLILLFYFIFWIYEISINRDLRNWYWWGK